MRGLLVGTLSVAGILAVAGCGAGSSTETVTVTVPPSPTATTTAGPSPSPATSASPSGTGAPAFHVRVALGGADAVAGSFDVALPPQGCVAPFHLAGDTGGHHLDVRLAASGGSSQPSPGDLVVAVDADTWVYGSSANGPAGSSGSVSTSNRAGAVAFVDLQLESDRSRTPQESGAIQWTCG